MSAITAKKDFFRATPRLFADEHLIYHMIQSAVDVQPNGFFRYISKTASERMKASRSAIDRKIDFYSEKGLLTKVMLQDEGFKQGRARYFKFLDASLERILFAFHGINPEPTVLGPGESSDDFEAMKDRLRGKSKEVKKALEIHMTDMPIKIQLLPDSVEMKIADDRRWPLTEANDLPGVEYLDIPNPVAYETRLLDIAKKADSPEKYIASLKEMVEKTKAQFPDAVDHVEYEIIDIKPDDRQVLKDDIAEVYYPYSLAPAPKHEQISIDAMSPGQQAAPAYGQAPNPYVFSSHHYPAPHPTYEDYRPAEIRIEDRAFDHLTKEDDSKVLSLITETLASNMKFMQDLAQMLSSTKMKEQMTALISMKEGVERENDALKRENAELRAMLAMVHENLNEAKLRKTQLDAYAMFETFFNLTPQDMYQQRKKYAKQIEDILHMTFQDVIDLSRRIK